MIDWLRRENLAPEIELGERILPINLHRHHRAKRLTLRIAPDGSAVRITLPAWAKSEQAIAFAHAKREWLAEQLAKIPDRAEPHPGTTLHFRGDPLRIEWDETLPRRPRIVSDCIEVGGPIAGLERRLQAWMEREALSLFERDVFDYCSAAALPIVPVGLSRAQRRWGSCSDKQRIRINWRLIQAPDYVRRSVVAHEVAHLVHFDHSPDFHTLLARIYEGDIGHADAWLKRYGRSLYASFG